ncbi:hypothetical protein ACQJBY_069199 [Aegilops geniculata]
MGRARRDRGSATSKSDAANGAKPPTGSSTTHVRQSVLYSARRGPRGRKGRPVEEHTGEVSSSELGHTSADLSQFDSLTLNTTPPTFQSSDRVEEHSTEVRSTEPNGTCADLSKDEGISLNVTSPAYESTDGAVVHGSNMDIGVPDSTIEKQPAVQEALSPRSEERRRRINQYLAEHTYNDVLEAMVAVKNGFCNPPKKVSSPNKSSEKLALPDSPQSPHRLDTQSSQTKIQCGESTKQIIKNGKLWMEKEVMKAFKKCIIEGEGLRGVEFELDELLHQCFSVETHEKMFHHYNFSVRMKEAGSDKWSSTLYFAQVKEMYGRKFYFCYPLDPNEDGLCYACKNEGMDALRHPAVPIGYETGQPDAGRPFVDDDSDDDCSIKLDNDDFVWAFEQVFCKRAPS